MPLRSPSSSLYNDYILWLLGPQRPTACPLQSHRPSSCCVLLISSAIPKKCIRDAFHRSWPLACHLPRAWSLGPKGSQSMVKEGKCFARSLCFALCDNFNPPVQVGHAVVIGQSIRLGFIPSAFAGPPSSLRVPPSNRCLFVLLLVQLRNCFLPPANLPL